MINLNGDLLNFITNIRKQRYDISPSLEVEPVTNFRYKCSIDLYAPSMLVANKVIEFKKEFTISQKLFSYACIKACENPVDFAKALYLQGFATKEETVYLYKLPPISEWCSSETADDFIKNMEVEKAGNTSVRLAFISPDNYCFGGRILFESEYIGDKFKPVTLDISEPVLVMTQYFRTNGVCNEKGKYAEVSNLTYISEDAYERFNDVVAKNGVNRIKHLYMFGIHTGSLKEICFKDRGIIERSCDDLTKFGDKLKILHTISKDGSSLKLDFGSDYEGTFGGYIEFKKMTQSEINCFKEVNINTFED